VLRLDADHCAVLLPERHSDLFDELRREVGHPCAHDVRKTLFLQLFDVLEREHAGIGNDGAGLHVMGLPECREDGKHRMSFEVLPLKIP